MKMKRIVLIVDKVARAFLEAPHFQLFFPFPIHSKTVSVITFVVQMTLFLTKKYIVSKMYLSTEPELEISAITFASPVKQMKS